MTNCNIISVLLPILPVALKIQIGLYMTNSCVYISVVLLCPHYTVYNAIFLFSKQFSDRTQVKDTI